MKVEHVENLLHKFDMNKATGYDQIPPNMVTLCSKELSQTLTELVNNAFKQNIFSDDMKRAEGTPIFKKKDDMIKNNYKPVSILSVFSKVFETLIAEQLRAYFENIFNNLLCAHRKKYGCEHVLVKLIDTWTYALDNDKFVGTLLIDLWKAFDCIPHGLLIAKMKAYGLSDEACTFMSSYICDRYQRVNVSNTKSL